MSAEDATTDSRPHVALPRTEPNPLGRLLDWAWEHAGLLAVCAAFLLAACVVPTLTPVGITDDWVYARSAQILLADGRLTIFPIAVATAVFQVAWGALFGLLLGPSLGVFRLSTVVVTALGALALYALCRELGVGRERSALGMAAYLFNPLAFVLAFTFMTDPHFAALLLIATWLFARGLDPHGIDWRFLLAGSGVAALAFLIRQQGALIPLAVIAFLVASRRLRWNRPGLLLLAEVGALPLLAIVGYYLWLRGSGSTGAMQGSFAREVVQRGIGGTWWLLRWLTFFQVIYLGFFTLPLMAAALPALSRLARGIPRRGWLLAGAWAVVAGAGSAVLAARGGYMPYIPQFFGPSGLGAPDVLGGRPLLLDREARIALTVACLLATLALALTAGRTVGAPPSVERSRAGLVVSIALGQAAGVFPPSYHFLGWSAGSVDRYLLPLAPLAIALALWGLRGVAMPLPVAWIIVAAMAIFSVAGTRDYLAFMGDVWAMGEDAVAAGVPLDRLDAGASWDGYHLYEYGLAHQIQTRTPKGGPWWTDLFAPATDSAYVVADQPLPGHDVVAQRPYSAWLQPAPTTIYLQVRHGEPWPPYERRADPLTQ